MKKLVAIDWNGRVYELEGDKAESLYDKLTQPTPENVRNYSKLSLFFDGIGVAVSIHPSKDLAVNMFETAKKAFPCGLATTEELIAVFNPRYVANMTSSWIAYGLTERQGGFWVLQ